MAVKLHRCSGMWAKFGGHPCWRVQKALDESGIEYELVKHSMLRPLRGDVKTLTGQKKLPLVEFEDGTFVRGSNVIAERAKGGTLQAPGETPPFG